MPSMFYLRALAVIASCSIMACADSADTPAAKASPAAATPGSPAINIAFKSDPNPPHSGDNKLEVTISNADGSPLNDATVTATFFMPAMPSMNMPEMRSVFALDNEGGGRYRGAGKLVMNGTWEVTVNVMRGAEKLGSRKLTVIAK